MKKKVGFGLAPDPFRGVADRCGILPLTVWNCSLSSTSRKLTKEVGDMGEARPECLYDNDKSVYNVKASIFNPMVAIWLINLYYPGKGKICYDPFAGGGTRAVVAAKLGLDYLGVELRKEEVEAVKARLKHNEVKARIIHADSSHVPQIKDNSADFLITCPPYYNLEKYKGGIWDLSMAKTYNDFLDGIEFVVKECYRIMKQGSICCWVVGLHRDEKSGELLPLNHDISGIHRDVGFYMKEEVILWRKATPAMQRVGAFEKGRHSLIRVHEYCLIFVR